MLNTLRFSASTNVKNLFGRELVTDQIAAIFELVKNSYDADAKEVNIIFSGINTDKPSITILDNGTGMDLYDIENRWMIIGTDSKKNTMYSPIFNRPLNGDKGIGRFSVDRLGSYLHMEAQKQNSTVKYLVDFDWSLFDSETRSISDIEIPYSIQTSSEDNQGVKLVISGLRDNWDKAKIQELIRSLRQLKSPFSQEDNFKIFVSAAEYGYNKYEVTVEKLEGVSSLWISAEISNENPDTIYLTVNQDGLEYEFMQSNPYSFGSVKAQIFMFNMGDKISFANRYGLRVREYGNIRLYRDNFRIYPYGKADNDWLDLDRRQTQGLLRKLGTRDLIGYIQIGKTTNPDLKPLTNRQGLEETESFKQLRTFVVDVCVKTLESYYFTKIKRAENETIKTTRIEISDAIDRLKKLANTEINHINPNAAKQIKDLVSTIDKQQKDQLRFIQDQQEIVKVYSRIAQKETFLHKLIHQSMIHINDAKVALDNYIKMAMGLNEQDKFELKTIQGSIQDAMYLLLRVRDDVVKKRTKSIHDIAEITRNYIHENKAYFEQSNVEVSVLTNGDLKYNIDNGDVKAILNNLATNAVKSLIKVNDRQRKLRFELYRTDKFLIIRCIDNGIGIPEADRERIFDPFQSTTGGFGLGLTIIDEIAKEYGGSLELIETEIGACFSVKLRC